MTTLRGCLDAAKESILSGATDRAIDLCFHILNSFPKCIEAHCLLGEAYREKGLAAQSESTLRRVLSADPESLVARWALSILEEEKGDIDSALIELRRAFELSPGHPELRRELARLSQSDVFLTRGGLGRIYARGELFDRAASEFREVLVQEPGRLDIQVALAEALWRDRQLGESRAVCQRILTDSPDCLKANIILGHILYLRGEHDNARKYLARAELLEPENMLAEQLLEGTEIEAQISRRELELPAFEAIEENWEDNSLALAQTTEMESVADEENMDYSSVLASLDFLQIEPVLPSTDEFEPSAEQQSEPATGQFAIAPLEPIEAGGVADAADFSAWQPAEMSASFEPSLEPIGESTIEPAIEPTIGPASEPIVEPIVEPSAEPASEWAIDSSIDTSIEEAIAPSLAPESSFSAKEEFGHSDEPADIAADLTAEPAVQHPAESSMIDLKAELANELEDGLELENSLGLKDLGDLGDDPDGVTDDDDNEFADDIDHIGDIGDIDEVVERSLSQDVSFLANLAAYRSRGAIPEETTGSVDDYTQICLQKVQEHPDDFQARLDLALAYHRSSKDDLAVAEFELVLKSSPDLVDRVIEGLKTVLTSNPDHMLAQRRLGDAYMKVGRFQEAIDCYNRCLNKQRTGNSASLR